MTDKNCNHDTFIRNFKSQVPMVESKPIMVTEIDWSPEDPDKASEGHYPGERPGEVSGHVAEG